MCLTVGPSGEAGALGALGTQQAASRPNSAGGRSFPVSHLGVGPGQATHHCPQGPGGHFQRGPFWGVAGCRAWGLAGVRRPLSPLGAAAFRGPGAGAIGAWPSQAAPGVSHLRLPLGSLRDFPSSNLGSSTRVKRRPTGSHVSRAMHGIHLLPRRPTPTPPDTCTSPLLPAPGLSLQAPPWDRNNFRLMAVWLHECQLNPVPAPTPVHLTTSDLGPQQLLR